jgi:hypothetical protein
MTDGDGTITGVTNPRDPRARRRAPAVDALAAAVRLEAAAAAMRDRATPPGPDEPPTAFLDLGAIRAAVAAAGTAPGPVDPAAAAWLAGGPDPGAAAALERVDRLHRAEPEVEFGVLFREPEPDPAPEVLELEPVPVVPPDALLRPAPAPAVVEHPCEQLGNAVHSNGPCGPQHTAIPLAPEPEPAPVFIPERDTGEWRSRHDERSRAFGVRPRLFGSAPLTDHLWPVGPILDQGDAPACTGFGTVAAVNARAAADTDLTAEDARALYRRAQALDGFPDSLPGSSVLAVMQAAQERGLIGGYLWAFGTRDVAQAVLQRGPVVIGIPWLPSLEEPGPGGLLTLAGEAAEGHCLAVVGLLLRGPQSQVGPFFVLQNSRGEAWGDHGLGYIHHRDLARLLRGSGEAAIPTTEAQS